MPDSRFAKFLLGTGVVVGVVATVGLAVGFKPSALPPALLDIAAYKLTFIAAGVLLAGGAFLLRWERRKRAAEARDVAAAQDETGDRLLAEPGLPEGKSGPAPRREADPVRAETPRT